MSSLFEPSGRREILDRLGRLNSAMYKHLDHHLRQFGS
jgi:hypothetical protein